MKRKFTFNIDCKNYDELNKIKEDGFTMTETINNSIDVYLNKINNGIYYLIMSQGLMMLVF